MITKGEDIDMKCTIIGIAGGTSSGKTTIATKLYNQTKKHGSVEIIRLDDYYHRHDHMSFEERCKINYDHPNAYDVNLLISQINDLKNGKSIEKPIYDFVEHNRKTETEVVNPCNVLIIEGILTFAIPELRDLFDIKLYVQTPDDIRFIRRLRRDVEERGRSVDSVINQYLETVRPMHIQFVEPSKMYADLIIPEGGKNKVALNIVIAKIVSLMKDELLED